MIVKIPFLSLPIQETELQGEVVQVSLHKTVVLGFTIIGGHGSEQPVQIESIIKGSMADGRLQVGDVLEQINGINVLSYSRVEVVKLIKNLPLNSRVNFEVRRRYPLQNLHAL